MTLSAPCTVTPGTVEDLFLKFDIDILGHCYYVSVILVDCNFLSKLA